MANKKIYPDMTDVGTLADTDWLALARPGAATTDYRVSGAAIGAGTGTATAVAGAATLNKRAGKITSEALTAATTYTLTLTNSLIAAGSIVLVTATNSANLLTTIATVTESAGQVIIVLTMAALTGTVIIRFAVHT